MSRMKPKTRKLVSKRFRITAHGHYKHPRAGRRHLLGGKSGTHSQALRRPRLVSTTDADTLRRLLPPHA